MQRAFADVARATVVPSVVRTTHSPNAYAVAPVARKPLSRTKFGPTSYLPSGVGQLALVLDVSVRVLPCHQHSSVGEIHVATRVTHLLGNRIVERLLCRLLGAVSSVTGFASLDAYLTGIDHVLEQLDESGASSRWEFAQLLDQAILDDRRDQTLLPTCPLGQLDDCLVNGILVQLLALISDGSHQVLDEGKVHERLLV